MYELNALFGKNVKLRGDGRGRRGAEGGGFAPSPQGSMTGPYYLHPDTAVEYSSVAKI